MTINNVMKLVYIFVILCFCFIPVDSLAGAGMNTWNDDIDFDDIDRSFDNRDFFRLVAALLGIACFCFLCYIIVIYLGWCVFGCIWVLVLPWLAVGDIFIPNIYQGIVMGGCWGYWLYCRIVD